MSWKYFVAGVASSKQSALT